MNDLIEERALKYLRLDRQLKEAQAGAPPTRQMARSSNPSATTTPVAPATDDGTQGLEEARYFAWVQFAAVFGAEEADKYMRQHEVRLNAKLDSEG